MKTWQPIETAPKNKPILIGAYHNKEWRVTTVEWEESKKQWTLMEAGWHAVYDDLYFNPTHWARLPRPPKPSDL